jgi:diacylglycerol O-acyltransferase / wax synthase
VLQLSPQDASFLYAETPLAPMSGGGLAIYDPSTAPGGKVTLKGLMSFIEERLHLAPFYRRKIVRVPFDVDHPWWVEDENFDIEFHVRHIALPEPGDWRQLCIQCARLVSRPLDLTKPLWETYVIDGLDRVKGYPAGCFGILSKVHHAAIDGASGAELATATQDLSPDAPSPTPPDTPWQGEPVPSDAALLARATWNNTTRPWQAVANLARNGAVRGLVEVIRRPPPGGQRAQSTPSTRFNRKVSAHRVVDGVTFDLDEIRVLRSMAPGSTVNDVVLAIEGGALRHYLQDKGELPSQSLTAMCPISLRPPGETASGGNQVGAMVVPLHTDVPDARSRLSAVHASTTAAKELQNAVGARTLTDLSQFIPAATAALAGRMAATMEIRYESSPPPYNTVVTNVPGPQQPLYMAGAKMVASYGFGMVHDNMGLMNVVTSYVGKVSITATADREMMPDPAFYAQCIHDSLDELKAAADVDAGSTPTGRRSPGSKNTRSRAPRAAATVRRGGSSTAPRRRAPRGNGSSR